MAEPDDRSERRCAAKGCSCGSVSGAGSVGYSWLAGDQHVVESSGAGGNTKAEAEKIAAEKKAEEEKDAIEMEVVG